MPDRSKGVGKIVLHVEVNTTGLSSWITGSIYTALDIVLKTLSFGLQENQRISKSRISGSVVECMKENN